MTFLETQFEIDLIRRQPVKQSSSTAAVNPFPFGELSALIDTSKMAPELLVQRAISQDDDNGVVAASASSSAALLLD